MKRKFVRRSMDQLIEEFAEAKWSSIDGKCRLVDDSSKVIADGHTWGVVSDHGNIELCHRGRNGHLYWHGGLV